MSIIKYANVQFSVDEIHNTDKILGNKSIFSRIETPVSIQDDLEIQQRFQKYAAQLRKVAPKAKDFLYFSCVMMRSAENSLVDYKTGEIKKDAHGNLITAEWVIDAKTGSWKWKCSDLNLHPTKNNNGDIFPESELKKAYKKWIGRPLCKDHQSSSVDGIRGIIVDTYYDDKFKRVIALCALDKINYPDLARKVESGYANSVSMGTAVGRSICYECGNVAKIEKDYCSHVKGRTTYGEINVDLNPIELSLVVTGADPEAQLRSVIASLGKYSAEKQERIEELKKAGCVTVSEFERIEKELKDLQATVQNLLNVSFQKEAKLNTENLQQARELSEILSRSPGLSEPVKDKINKEIEKLLQEEGSTTVEPPYGVSGNKAMTGGQAQPYQDPDGTPPEYAAEGRETRLASDELKGQINAIHNKLDVMQNALRALSSNVQEANFNKEGQNMSDSKLRERAAARRATFQKAAYSQGGGGLNDPQTYPVDPMNDKLKTDGDKQMEGQGMEPGKDGLHPGYKSFGKSEEELKKMLARAELEERKLRRHALLATAEEPKKVFELNGKKYVAEGDKLTELKADDMPTKQAYFQGGGGLNEPQTYPVDPMNDKLKTDGDKQMEGQGMESGKDGMHPGYQSTGPDLALKEKVLRASLMPARTRNGELNKSACRWEIYAGKDKILEATGAEVYEDTLEANWDLFASEKYGKKVIEAIREHGLDQVAYWLKGVVKSAQEPMPPMPPMPAGPEAGGAPAPLPPLPEEKPAEEKGDKSPVEETLGKLDESLEDAEKFLGDLKDVLQETTGKTETDLPSPTEAADDDEEEDKEEMKADDKDEEEEDTDEMKADDEEEAAVVEAAARIREVYASLDESADEIAMLAESLESRIKAGKTASDSVTGELLRLATEALKENETLRSEAEFVVDAAKKGKKEEPKKGKKSKKDEDDEDDKPKGKKELPKGLKKFKKEKDEEDEDDEPKKGKKSKKDEDDEDERPAKKGKSKKDEDDEEDKPKKGKKSKAEQLLENMLVARAAKRRELVRQATGEELVIEEGSEDVSALKAELAAVREELNALKSHEGVEESEGEEPLFTAEEAVAPDTELAADEMYLDDELTQLLDEGTEEIQTTAAQRRAWREKVAAEVGQKYQLKLDPATGVDTDMPINPSAPVLHEKVEGIVEQYDEIMKQVKNLPKVREAFEKITHLVKSGALSLADFDNAEKLKALAVDPEAAKYWRQYFGEGDAECKEFGNELVKELKDKKASLDIDTQRIKMRRAYDMALEMQDKSLIASDISTLHKQVDEIMQFDTKSFESFKRALASVNKKAGVKNASPTIQVGIKEGDELGEGIGSVPAITDQLKKLW